MRLSRRERPPLEVAAGERLLAWAKVSDGVVGGTRDALYVVSMVEPVETRIPWEQVESADWDRETSILRVSELGTWGEVRPVHRLSLEAPGRLLELVRERVTASIVLQRHVPLVGPSGVRVIARRAPRGDQPLLWVFEYDEGVDPSDPAIRAAAEDALALARAEVEPA